MFHPFDQTRNKSPILKQMACKNCWNHRKSLGLGAFQIKLHQKATKKPKPISFEP